MMATTTASVKTCSTCDTEKPIAEFNVKLSQACTHERIACRDCVVSWIEGKIADGQWENIICCEDCAETIDNFDIPKLLSSSPAALGRFDKLALASSLGDMPNFQYCLSPTCSSGQIHVGGADANPIFKCQACGTKYCLIHHNIWHENQTCAEYDDIVRERHEHEKKASEEMVERTARECPGCHRPIEKNGGCEHMTCRMCKHEFCYLCLADYSLIRKKDNSYHASNCPFHSNNLR